MGEVVFTVRVVDTQSGDVLFKKEFTTLAAPSLLEMGEKECFNMADYELKDMVGNAVIWKAVTEGELRDTEAGDRIINYLSALKDLRGEISKKRQEEEDVELIEQGAVWLDDEDNERYDAVEQRHHLAVLVE